MLYACKTPDLMTGFMKLFGSTEMLKVLRESLTSSQEVTNQALWIVLNAALDKGEHRDGLVQAGVLQSLMEVS
jgi:hypothetical protein